MSYFPVNIAGARLTIDGTDYSAEFVSFNVSDDSVVSSSIITTNGQIVLAQTPSTKPVNDYLGTIFTKGKTVKLDIKQPNGEYVRHPRGHLYILKSIYSIENKLLTLDVGCGLAYAAKYESQSGAFIEELLQTFVYDDLAQIIPATSLTPWLAGQEPYSLSFIGEALEVEGNCIYQDRWGFIQKVNIFGENGFYSANTSVPYKFTSYDTDTCLSLTPQSETGSEVDQVTVTANTEVLGTEGEPEYDDEGDDVDGLEDAFEPYETDQDYIEATTCRPDQSTQNTILIDEERQSVDYENPAYSLVGDDRIINPQQFLKNNIATITYKEQLGPGNQISREISMTSGDIKARLSGDYSTLFNNLVNSGDSRRAAYRSCESVFDRYYIHDAVLTSYDYGKGGELVKKTTTTYGLLIDKISDARKQESDFAPEWGYWVSFGEIRANYTPFGIRVGIEGYVNRVEIIEYEYNLSNGINFKYNQETTKVYDYVAMGTRGSSGYSKTVKKSGGNLVNPSQQDYLRTDADTCPPINQTSESREIVETVGVSEETQFSNDGLSEADFESDNNVINVDYPLDLPPAVSLETLKSYKGSISGYANTVYQKLAADSRGFTIQEALRPEFYSWYPSYPYRLVVSTENKSFYMRVSASTWTVTPNESVCSFESMMIAEYGTSSVASPPKNSQLEYLLPQIVSPTTSNNQLLNHETTLGAEVRSVTTVPLSPPVITTVPITFLPSLSPTSLRSVIKIGGVITFNPLPRLSVKTVTPFALPPAQPPVTINFSIPVALNVGSLVTDFGTITAPAGVSVDFNTISNPSSVELNAGTVSAPNF